MTGSESIRFNPDYAVEPGETLAEVLEERGMTQAELARRTGLSTKHINQVIKGAASITAETALKLERVTLIPARFWTNLETQYRDAKSREEESLALETEIPWLKDLPIKYLQDRDWIPKITGPDLVRSVFEFFGVASRDAWATVWATPTGYRMSRVHESNGYSLASWLRIAELEASKVEAMPFDRKGLQVALPNLRHLTRRSVEEWYPRLIEECASVGVVVVLEPEVPGSRVCGAVRWVDSDRVLIVMSLRHKWADVFWFSFFHEVAHILLHDRKKLTFIDGPPANGETDELELEADVFASRTLIPREFESHLPMLQSRSAIISFAKEIGIHPGIVVGRLQHQRLLPFSQLNDLKERYVFSD
jgi:HTH-type transcriptional regulator/antitoxin HigA